MGVNNLWKLLSPVGRRISIETLERKTLAVDMSIWLVKFIKSMRDEDGKVTKNAHIIGTLRRVIKLLYHRILPVFVFDGGAPRLKEITLRGRRRLRQNADMDVTKQAQRILMAQLKRLAKRKALQQIDDFKSVGKFNDLRPELTNGLAPGFNPALQLQESYIRDEIVKGSPPVLKENVADTIAINQSDEDDKMMWEPGDDSKDIVEENWIPSRPAAAVGSDSENDQYDDWENSLILPEDATDIDPKVLASLPPDMRKKVIEAAQRQNRMHSRQQYIPVAANPALYSQTQISNFLRSSGLNKKISEIQTHQESESFGKRIASDATRKYILERDDQVTRRNSSPTHETLQAVHEKLSSTCVRESLTSCSEANQCLSNANRYTNRTRGLQESSEGSQVSDSNFIEGIEIDSNSKNKTEENSDCEAGFILDFEPGMHAAHTNTSITQEKMSHFLNKSLLFGNNLQSGEFIEAHEHGNHLNMEENSTDVHDFRKYDDNDEGGFILEADTKPNLIESVSNIDKMAPQNVKTPLGREDLVQLEIKPILNREGMPLKGEEVHSSRIFPCISFDLNNREKSMQETSIEMEDSKLKNSSRLESIDSSIGRSGGNVVDLLINEKQVESDSGIELTLSDFEEEPELVSALFQSNLYTNSADSVQIFSENSVSAENSAALQSGLATASKMANWAGRVFEKVMRDSLKTAPAIYKTNHKSTFENFNDKIVHNDHEIECIGGSINNTEANKVDAFRKTEIYPLSNAPTNQDKEVNVDVKTQFAGEQYKEKIINDDLNNSSVDSAHYSDSSDEEMNAKTAYRKAQRDAETVTEEMLDEVKHVLHLLGVPYIVAPMEAEAQCVELERLGLVEGTITDDSDAFVFGAKAVYKNIFEDKKYVEAYLLSDIKAELGLDTAELRGLAMLMGSDYTLGIKNVGLVNAMEIMRAFPLIPGETSPAPALRRFKSWLDGFNPFSDAELESRVFKAIKDGPEAERKEGITEVMRFHVKHRGAKNRWVTNESFPSEEVLKAYERPQVCSAKEKFKWMQPDEESLCSLCEQVLGWAPGQCEALLNPVVARINEKNFQARIDNYFTSYQSNSRFAKIRSRRLLETLTDISGSEPIGRTDVDEPSSKKLKAGSFVSNDHIDATGDFKIDQGKELKNKKNGKSKKCKKETAERKSSSTEWVRKVLPQRDSRKKVSYTDMCVDDHDDEHTDFDLKNELSED